MSPSRIVGILVIVGLLVWGTTLMRDPYRAPLPEGTTDLSAIEAKLKKLPSEERKLVEDYVKRSGGLILPARKADPDTPLTARNVREAIDLQKKFIAYNTENEALRRNHQESETAAREERLAPMRNAISIKLIKREILTPEQRSQEQDSTGGAKKALSKNPFIALTFRVTNTTNNEIKSFKTWVTMSKSDATGSSGAASCTLEHNGVLQAGTSVELRCLRTTKLTDEDLAFVGMPESNLELDWVPNHVVFSNGTALR